MTIRQYLIRIGLFLGIRGTHHIRYKIDHKNDDYYLSSLFSMIDILKFNTHTKLRDRLRFPLEDSITNHLSIIQAEEFGVDH